MASFVKRGKSWSYIVSHKPKPIRKGGFRTKKEAQVAAAEVEEKLSKGILPHLKLEPFADYFQSWLSVYKVGISLNTLSRYEATLKTITDYFGDKPIQHITMRDYQELLNIYGMDHAPDASEKQRSIETAKKLNTHIRSCVQTAIQEGIIQKDFTFKAKVSGARGKRPEEKHLDYEDSELLLNEIYNRLGKSHNYYILLLALTSGMRFGEIVGLQRSDFDFINNTINISKIWGYTKKMDPGFGRTKTYGSVRRIKMDVKTMSVFKQRFKQTPDNIERLVFYSQKSKYKVPSNDGTNKTLKNLLSDLGIDDITVHGLRHTHASMLLYKGVSIYYVSERLGHEGIETTLKHYAHVMKELRLEDEMKTTAMFDSMII